MNFKALITTLVLGSSAIAAADPCAPAPAPAPVYTQPAPAPAYLPTPVYTRPVVQPIVQPPPIWRGPYYNITNTTLLANASVYHGSLANSPTRMRLSRLVGGRQVLRPSYQSSSWFALTEATRIDRGQEIFRVGADNGWFRSLELQNMGTRGSEISRVKIDFVGGGASQLVRLNTKLDVRHPTLSIDLDGQFRQISRITVYGSTDAGAAYKILAM